MGLRNLYRRKARTLLTVLGVVIGTAAIVVMLSLGIGMNERSEKQIRSMGSLNIIEVNNYGMYNESGRSSQSSVLDDKAVSQFSNMEGVEAATPMLETYLKLVSGKYVAYTQLIGIDTRVMSAFDYKVSEGRLLQEGEANAIVAGVNIPYNFYNPKSGNSFRGFYMGGSGEEKPPVDIMNDKLELTFDMSYGEKRPPGGTGDNSQNKPAKLYKIKVAGLLAQSNDEKDYNIYMDINQLKKMMKEYERSRSPQERRRNTHQQQESYNRVLVKVKEIKDVDAVQEKIKQMGFGTFSLSDIRKSMQEQARTIQMVLGGIGAISLLIAALGITNTMIMSIYERTREIGVMKVLGCMLGDIRRLFLFEAGMIGLMGGIAGIAFSVGASALLNYVGGGFMEAGGIYMGDPSEKISVIPLWLILSSVGFAVLIGLVSGFYPARRAMKLSALEAIKTE
ncbi:ABC transporter permease [Anaerobacterium chartisolvens]|nr:FtsX-like permease family protein [Anaerobacterium chartisolvens]